VQVHSTVNNSRLCSWSRPWDIALCARRLQEWNTESQQDCFPWLLAQTVENFFATANETWQLEPQSFLRTELPVKRCIDQTQICTTKCPLISWIHGILVNARLNFSSYKFKPHFYNTKEVSLINPSKNSKNIRLQLQANVV